MGMASLKRLCLLADDEIKALLMIVTGKDESHLHP